MKTLYNKISQAVKALCSPSLTGRAGVGLSYIAKMLNPPSTTATVPVTNFEASDIR